jgi:hypothetical protein
MTKVKRMTKIQTPITLRLAAALGIGHSSSPAKHESGIDQMRPGTTTLHYRSKTSPIAAPTAATIVANCFSVVQ